MNEQNKKVPTVRFKGFTNDWEQRKLRDISTRVLRKNKDLQSTLPLTISAQDGLVDQTTFFHKQVASKQLSNYILLFKGEFAYNKSYSEGYPFGAIKRLNKYSKGVLSTLYIVFKPKNVNSDFLEHYYDTSKWYREIYRNAAEGARNHGLLNISAKDFFGTMLYMPQKNEQALIANVLDHLDSLITLQQRKLELLKEIKKGLLQKMFAEKNSNQPVLRFKGFHDDWEQRKLGDVAQIETGKLDANAMVEGGKYDFYTSGIKKYHIDIPAFEGPAITIAGNGATVGYMHLADGMFNAYQRTYVLTKFIATDRRFLFNEIGNNLPRKIQQESRAGNIPYIVMDMLTGLKISLPSFAEQEKIGKYFADLDSLIALHQRKQNHFKLLKKSLLQQMFM